MSDDLRGKMPECEHHWVSHHQPDFPPPIYWVRICSLCNQIDGADLARELATRPMTADLRAGIEAKIAEWERHGLAFKRESPAIAATIRNIMADFRARLAAHPVQDEGAMLTTEAAHAATADAYEAGRRDAMTPVQVTTGHPAAKFAPSWPEVTP